MRMMNQTNRKKNMNQEMNHRMMVICKKNTGNTQNQRYQMKKNCKVTTEARKKAQRHIVEDTTLDQGESMQELG